MPEQASRAAANVAALSRRSAATTVHSWPGHTDEPACRQTAHIENVCAAWTSETLGPLEKIGLFLTQRNLRVDAGRPVVGTQHAAIVANSMMVATAA